jgi:hypothetical protein
MKRMQKGNAVCARDCEAQQKERTIDSQVLEPKAQIAAAGSCFVKKYIDVTEVTQLQQFYKIRVRGPPSYPTE